MGGRKSCPSCLIVRVYFVQCWFESELDRQGKRSPVWKHTRSQQGDHGVNDGRYSRLQRDW